MSDKSKWDEIGDLLEGQPHLKITTFIGVIPGQAQVTITGSFGGADVVGESFVDAMHKCLVKHRDDANNRKASREEQRKRYEEEVAKLSPEQRRVLGI
jgi:hypothetical protein